MNIPPPNSICAYTFTTNFASLDGIYILAEILSYNEAIATNVDFVTHLYTPANLTAAQYASDAYNYINDTILYLTPVNTTNVPLYVPSSLLASMPDPMIGCYNHLAIGIDLGLFEDQTHLAWIISELNSIITATTGTNNPVKLYSLGTEQMRIADYNNLVAQRQALKQNYTTLYEQLQAQITLTQAAQNLNVYYQNTLVNLSTLNPGES